MRKANNIVISLAALMIFMISCQKQDVQLTSEAKAAGASSNQSDKQNTFYGPEKALGQGKAKSFITISHSGVPIEYGIIMNAKSMYGLPADDNNHTEGTYYLPLHQKVKDVTPFTFIMLNWNPKGHDPINIYGLPHFDFHFYFNMSMEEQMAIMPGAALEKAPPAGYLPADYIAPAPGVPMMGKHWLDKFAPELPPTLAKFDKTFIYGTYDGKVIFYEPMITRETLMSGNSYSLNIKQPAKFSPTSAYYPTKYNIYKDSKTGDIMVSLSNFVWR